MYIAHNIQTSNYIYQLIFNQIFNARNQDYIFSYYRVHMTMCVKHFPM